jgi:radical SAM-linked protein
MTWWVLTFARRGPARYLSHLDTARGVQRTFARAGVPIALSQGMRPKPRISLPLPLPVGAVGSQELAVVEVPDELLADQSGLIGALRELRAAASPGIEPLSIAVIGEQHPRPQAVAAQYLCVIDGDAGVIAAAVERYNTEVSVICERISPKGRRTLDLKEYVVDCAVEPVTGGAQVGFTIRPRADGAARPQEFIDLIARWAGVEAAMRGLERRRIVWKGLPQGSTTPGPEGVNPCE